MKDSVIRYIGEEEHDQYWSMVNSHIMNREGRSDYEAVSSEAMRLFPEAAQQNNRLQYAVCSYVTRYHTSV